LSTYMAHHMVICILQHCKTSLGMIFFFFQAEDGIRDRNVTGVQTCALPISICWSLPQILVVTTFRITPCSHLRPTFNGLTPGPRSEERRVGKECRSRCTSDE